MNYVITVSRKQQDAEGKELPTVFWVGELKSTAVCKSTEYKVSCWCTDTRAGRYTINIKIENPNTLCIRSTTQDRDDIYAIFDNIAADKERKRAFRKRCDQKIVPDWSVAVRCENG